MLYCNDFSQYQAENILQTPSNTAHSGPELCYAMPDSVLANNLAREVVLGKISLATYVRPTSVAAAGDSYLKMTL